MKYNVAATRICDHSGLPSIKVAYANTTWGLNVMKLRKLALVFAALGMATAAFAGDQMKTKMAIAVIDSDSHGEVRLDLDSDELGFDLQDMQEGENRSIVDKSGRSILITREADGYSFDVDGKTIKMPLFDDEIHNAVWVGDANHGDFDFDVMHDFSIAAAHGLDGVMIVSQKPIDEATQQAIKSMLQSAGHGDEVRFIDTDGAEGGPHMIKVIEKKVEVRN